MIKRQYDNLKSDTKIYQQKTTKRKPCLSRSAFLKQKQNKKKICEAKSMLTIQAIFLQYSSATSFGTIDQLISNLYLQRLIVNRQLLIKEERIPEKKIKCLESKKTVWQHYTISLLKSYNSALGRKNAIFFCMQTFTSKPKIEQMTTFSFCSA